MISNKLNVFLHNSNTHFLSQVAVFGSHASTFRPPLLNLVYMRTDLGNLFINLSLSVPLSHYCLPLSLSLSLWLWNIRLIHIFWNADMSDLFFRNANSTNCCFHLHFCFHFCFFYVQMKKFSDSWDQTPVLSVQKRAW